MARTYSTTKLALNDPSDADWALAYVRFALRDKPNDASTFPSDSLDDEEINAALEAAKITDTVANGGDGTVYYEAHKVAARLLQGNPEWVSRFSAGGYSEERRSATEVAWSVKRAGKWIDASIIDSTDGRIGGSSLVLRT